MKKQTNFNITISGGIYKNFRVNSDGSVTVLMETHGYQPPAIKTESDITFTSVPITSITSDDDFLWYIPLKPSGHNLKERIREILKENTLKDFFIPEDYTKVKLFGQPIEALHYGSESCNTWINSAALQDCKIITYSQYVMLLAWMIKTLTEKEGWRPAKAWNAICENSEILSDLNWKRVFGFKSFLTGANKYLLPDDPINDKGCYIASGGVNGRDWNYPLARISKDGRRDCDKRNAPYLCYGFLCK